MAGRISKETIAQINNSDIVSVVSEYAKLERHTGDDWWFCCPIHGEKTASFHVLQNKKMFHCFGCNRGGNIVSFLMEMEKISYVEALETLAKRFNIEIKYENGYAPPADYKKDNRIEQNIELYERTASMFHYFLMETEQGKFALDYIKKRGLTEETLKKFKIGYAPADIFWLRKFLKSKNYSDDFLDQSGLFCKNKNISLFNDRLIFPIFDRQGKVVAFGGRILHPKGPKDSKYFNSPELIHYHKKSTLFGFNFAKKAIKDNNKVILCEGYMDCVAYHQCGIEYAVAPLGTGFTEEQLKILQSFTDTVLLSFDSDNAGQNATMRAIFMCRKSNLTVKIIRLKGGKDPADIMLAYGKENLTAQVNSAILDSDYLLSRLGEKYPLDNPESKARIAREFFAYVDVLQSNIQKESCLEQLCQTFNLKPEAVKRDFVNRNQSQEQNNYVRQKNNQNNQVEQIKLDAELRGLIAVMADLDQYRVFRSSVSVNDLRNPAAKSLYNILEECYNDGSFSFPEILTRCRNSGSHNNQENTAGNFYSNETTDVQQSQNSLSNLITEVISSGVYHSENASVVVSDTIKFIKKNSLEDQRDKIVKRLRDFSATEEDNVQLKALLEKKMELDKQVQLLSK